MKAEITIKVPVKQWNKLVPERRRYTYFLEQTLVYSREWTCVKEEIGSVYVILTYVWDKCSEDD